MCKLLPAIKITNHYGKTTRQMINHNKVSAQEKYLLLGLFSFLGMRNCVFLRYIHEKQLQGEQPCSLPLSATTIQEYYTIFLIFCLLSQSNDYLYTSTKVIYYANFSVSEILYDTMSYTIDTIYFSKSKSYIYRSASHNLCVRQIIEICYFQLQNSVDHSHKLFHFPLEHQLCTIRFFFLFGVYV